MSRIAREIRIFLAGDLDFFLFAVRRIATVVLDAGFIHHEPFKFVVEYMRHPARLRLEDERWIFHPPRLHEFKQTRHKLISEKCAEIAHPFVTHAIAPIEQRHVGKMHARVIPHEQRRMLLRQLTVNYREHARDLPALRLEPGDKPFDLLHRILAPLADEENVRGRPRQLTRDQTEVAEAVRRMIFNVRAANADDHGKNHSFLFDEATTQWTLSPAYDLTLNADEGRDYQGLTPNTFGSTPRLTTLAAVAADAGIGRDEFDKIDAEVSAVIQRWPEFAAAAELPAATAERAAAIHLGVANVLATEVTAKRGKRRKLWE